MLQNTLCSRQTDRLCWGRGAGGDEQPSSDARLRVTVTEQLSRRLWSHAELRCTLPRTDEHALRDYRCFALTACTQIIGLTL